MTIPATSIALHNSWLDEVPTGGHGGALNTATLANVNWDSTAGNVTAPWTAAMWWPYQPNYYNWWYTPCYHPEAKPIKLTMSEVAKLRAVAQKDAKVKAILAKFTDLIEVTVDFE